MSTDALLPREPVQVTLSDGTQYAFKEINTRQHVALLKSSREMIIVLMGEANPVEVAMFPNEALIEGLAICTGIPVDQIWELHQDDIVRLTMAVSEANSRFFVERTLPVLLQATQKAGDRKAAAMAALEQMLAGLSQSNA